MSDCSYVAPPMGRQRIRSLATQIRVAFDLDKRPWFPVVEMMEWVLGEFAPGFEIDIRTKAEMGANHGLTDHERKLIILREDVYEGACDGLGRDRGTCAHEIFHAIVHRPARLARRMEAVELEAFRDPEWQTKAFQGELLMYHQLAGQCRNYMEAARVFGVSEDAAKYQWGQYKKEGLIAK